MSKKRQSLINNKNIVGIPIKLKKTTVRTVKKKSVQRVGVTNNFVIDYDSNESMILIYGKDAPDRHGIKLGLDKGETTAILKHLRQAKLLFNH